MSFHNQQVLPAARTLKQFEKLFDDKYPKYPLEYKKMCFPKTNDLTYG